MKHLSHRLTGLLALTLLATRLPAEEKKVVAPAPQAAVAVSAAGKNELGLDVLRLSPRVAVVYGDPWDNAVVGVATRNGIVVVDAPFSRTIAGAFREAIQAELKRNDVAYLINTHDHVCHVGGNEAFADVPIIGHESLRREMLKLMADAGRAKKVSDIGERELAKVRAYYSTRDPKQLDSPGFVAYERGWRTIQADLHGNPVLVPPNLTFDREMTLHLGDVEVRLIYYGHTHGVADTLVSIPGENLVLTGGAFDPNRVPTLDAVAEEATPAIVDNWFVVMHGLLKEANGETRFVPSHGRTMMKKEQVDRAVAYLEGLWTGLRRARSSGRTLDQAKSDLPLSAFPGVAGLPNEALRGSEWENLDIHGHNVEHLWKVLDRTAG